MASLPPRRAQVGVLVVASCVACILVTTPIRDELQLYEFYAGFVAVLLTVGYAVFLRSQSALLAISPATISLGNKSVSLPGAAIEVRGWTTRLHQHGAALWIASGADELRLGVLRGPPSRVAAPRFEAGVDGILTEADFEWVLDALGCADAADAFRATASHDHEKRPTRLGAAVWAMLPWIITLVLLGAFGVGIGLFAPSFLESRAGEIVVRTVTFGGIALGLFFTLARRPSSGAHRGRESAPLQGSSSGIPQVVQPQSADGRPTFARVGLNFAAWHVVSVVIAGLLFLPVWLVESAFKHWVDIPGCQATCASRGLAFESYLASKSAHVCMCVGGPPIHIRYHVFGGDSVAASILDGLVRAVSYVGFVLAWWGVYLGLALRFWLLRRKKVGAPPPDRIP